MYPEPIEHYFAPTTLAEVFELLRQHGGTARILAGGQSLMQQMKARRLAPRTLIDINRVRGLDAISVDYAALHLGALVRFSTAAKHPALRDGYAALADAAAAVGDRQVRNRGTLVGSIVFSANYGDIAPAAAALGAEVIVARADPVQSAGQERWLAIEQFVVGPGCCDLQAYEIVTGLRVPRPPAAAASCYLKHGRAAQDRATLGVAVRIGRNRAGSVTDIRIALGGLANHPIVRAHAAETALQAQICTPALLDEAGGIAAESIATQTDELSSAAYRTQLIRVYVPRALETAWRRITVPAT